MKRRLFNLAAGVSLVLNFKGRFVMQAASFLVVLLGLGQTFAVAQNNSIALDAAIEGFTKSFQWVESSAIEGHSEWASYTGDREEARSVNNFVRYVDHERVEVSEASPTDGGKTSRSYRSVSTPTLAFHLLDNRFMNAWQSSKGIDSVAQSIRSDAGSESFFQGRVQAGEQGYVDLPELFSTSKSDVGAERGMFGDESCVVLDLKKAPNRYKVWLIPEKGYACARYEVNFDFVTKEPDRPAIQGTITETSEVTEWQKINTYWIAKAGNMRHESRLLDGSTSGRTVKVSFSSVRLNPDFQAIGAFKTDNIPNGIPVTLMDFAKSGPIRFEWREGKIVPVIPAE